MIADATYDADHLRDCIAQDLGASAHTIRNPARREDRPINWTLYKERQLVECFLNLIQWFRRIALRCEKTISSFSAFVNIACVMEWLA